VLWSLSGGTTEWFSGTIESLGERPGELPVVAYDADGMYLPLSPEGRWRRLSCAHSSATSYATECAADKRGAGGKASTMASAINVLDPATIYRRDLDINSDRSRLAAFLRKLGGSEQLIAGWEVTISSADAASTDEAPDGAKTQGCFVSREGKRFRTFLAVARHLGLPPAPQALQQCADSLGAGRSLLMPLPNCQTRGHRFDIPGSRRCSVCRRIVMAHSNSSRAQAHSRQSHGSTPLATFAVPRSPSQLPLQPASSKRPCLRWHSSTTF